MTDKEFRELTRDWFKELVRTKANDVDRQFARMVHLSATQVNHIVNDKRFPTWRDIEKVTTHLGIRMDEFLLDLIRLWRARMDQGRAMPH